MYEASLAFWIDYFSSLRIYSLVWELLSARTLNVISLASAFWVMISSWAMDLPPLPSIPSILSFYTSNRDTRYLVGIALILRRIQPKQNVFLHRIFPLTLSWSEDLVLPVLKIVLIIAYSM